MKMALILCIVIFIIFIAANVNAPVSEYCDIFKTEESCAVPQCNWCGTTQLCTQYTYCPPCEELEQEECMNPECHYCSSLSLCKPIDFSCTCGNSILEATEECDGGINCPENCQCPENMIPDEDNGCKENQTSPDEDNDTIPDLKDLCPKTPKDEPVDGNGCSDPQFCAKQPMCGLLCDNADWKDNEQNSPKDCRTVIVAKEGAYYPFCAGLVCAD